MHARYDDFCVADPIFFESITGKSASSHEFSISACPLPGHWKKQVNNEWLIFGPTEAELPPQGWKIHLSGCLDNAEKLLAVLWDYCVARDIPFKFLRGPRMLLMRNSKYAPRAASGKLATIYPATERQCRSILEELDELVGGEPGPYVLSDLRWREGPLYVRYGGFDLRRCLSDSGELVPAIADSSGKLVPDLREPVFRVPEWVRLPDFLADQLELRNSSTAADLPYQVRRALHFSNGGGLYLATAAETGRQVVLKEARPHAGLDGTGADAITRLRRERDMLTRLAGVAGVPEVHDYLSIGGHEFLVMEYIDGIALNKLLVHRYPLINPAAGPDEFAAYTRWALDIHRQVEAAVAQIAERGVVYGDLHLFNVLVREDDSIALIDFEVAAAADEDATPALRNQGFAAPRGVRGTAVDTYALACLRLALFLPITAMLRLAPAKARDFAAIITEHFPVPPEFLAAAVAEIDRAHGRTGAGHTTPVIEPTDGGWLAARERLATAILASATPDRDDRLFPGDIEQFRTGGLGLAHGAAGVLYALSVTGAGRFPEHEDWLLSHATTPPTGTRCGLYDGLHGVAFALDHLGHHRAALDLVDLCLADEWEGLGADLFGGLAGIGLNLVHFAAGSGECEGERYLRAARRAAELADRAVRTGGERAAVGLLHGASGPALLFLRLYQQTGDHELLELAASALRRDLDRCVTRPDGALEVDEGWRTMPYLGRGSAGIDLVLREYLRHRHDERFAEASGAIGLAARSPMYVQSGLFAGRAGILYCLADRHGERPDPELRAGIEAQARNLAWHAVDYGGGLAFPGEQLLRLSMDLATGTAGVLLALGAALHDHPAGLPLISPSSVVRLSAPAG